MRETGKNSVLVSSQAPADVLLPSIFKPAVLGFSVLLIFSGILAAWSCLAPLASVVLAPGTVVVEGRRKVVQHQEGGTIKEIAVHEGSFVRDGQTLIMLDGQVLRASLLALDVTIAQGLAVEARLDAERSGAKPTTCSIGTTQAQQVASRMCRDQVALQQARRTTFEAKHDALQIERAQLNQDLLASGQEVVASQFRRNLDIESLQNELKLYNLQVESRSKLQSAERVVSQDESEIRETVSRVSRLQSRLATLKTEETSEKAAFNEGIETERQLLVKDMSEAQRLKAVLSNQLSRLSVKSPVTGFVLNLQVHTVGGVVSAGMPLMEIVPSSTELSVEAEVAPRDVQFIKAGSEAELRFDQAASSYQPRLVGKVVSVSSDSLSDRQSGAPYYAVTVQISGHAQRSLRSQVLRSGMPVSVLFPLKERTLFQYLAEPLARFVIEPMREP